MLIHTAAQVFFKSGVYRCFIIYLILSTELPLYGIGNPTAAKLMPPYK